MPRLEDGTWISDRQAALRNEVGQLDRQAEDNRLPEKEKTSMRNRANRLRKKIR